MPMPQIMQEPLKAGFPNARAAATRSFSGTPVIAAVTAGGLVAACGGTAPVTPACHHAVARLNADINTENIDGAGNLFPPQWLMSRSRERKAFCVLETAAASKP